MKHQLEQLKLHLESFLQEDFPEGTPDLINAILQDLDQILEHLPGTDDDWPLPELAKAAANITGKSYRTMYRRLDERIRSGNLYAYIGMYTEFLTRTKEVQLVPKVAGDLILQEFEIKKLQRKESGNNGYPSIKSEDSKRIR